MTEVGSVLVLNERDLEHPKAGGAEVHVFEIFERLVERGARVTLATSSFKGAPSRVRMRGLDVWRLGGLARYYPRVAWTCARETRRGRFDLVVECLNKVPFYSPLYSSVPVLALCHHLFGNVAFEQVSLPIAATVWAAERLIPPLYRKPPFVTISESSRLDLIERGIPAERIRVIHCGITRAAFQPEPIKSRSMRVAYVGRLELYKNIDLILRAMARLADRLPDVEIVIIGQGADRPRLESIARELGLAQRTRFTGFISDEERDRLVADTRVCVCPSSKEGWGLTMIEANGLGTPVVATDAPGLRDSVRHDQTGFLARDGDVEGFARRIAELLLDDALAERMSGAALEWSRQFDWDDAATQMAEVLEGLRSSP